MIKKRRSNIPPLEIERCRAWFSVLMQMCEFKSKKEFISFFSRKNFEFKGGKEEETYIIKNPDKSVRDWLGGRPPSYETLRQLSLHISEWDSSIDYIIISSSYLYGPGGLFRGYQLGSQVQGSLLSINSNKDMDWILRKALFPEGLSDSLLKHTILGKSNDVDKLMGLVHQIFIECESLALSKYIVSFNPHPHYMEGIPAAEAVTCAQLRSAIEKLSEVLEGQINVQKELSSWGLSLDTALELIPKQFLFLFKKMYPKQTSFAQAALNELAILCVNYAPLEPIFRSIMKDNVK